eukprot:3717950-Karenia_brevis.AAC.1
MRWHPVVMEIHSFTSAIMEVLPGLETSHAERMADMSSILMALACITAMYGSGGPAWECIGAKEILCFISSVIMPWIRSMSTLTANTFMMDAR